LFGGGKKKDKHQDKMQQSVSDLPAPCPQLLSTLSQLPPAATEDHIDEAPPASKHKEKLNEELLRQKEQLEHERVSYSLWMIEQ